MTNERHLMICTGDDGTRSHFECTVDGCGRSVLLDHTTTRLIVLTPGNEVVPHNGSTGLVALSATHDRDVPGAP